MHIVAVVNCVACAGGRQTFFCFLRLRFFGDCRSDGVDLRLHTITQPIGSPALHPSNKGPGYIHNLPAYHCTDQGNKGMYVPTGTRTCTDRYAKRIPGTWYDIYICTDRDYSSTMYPGM